MLTACYDLGRCPPTYDAISFLGLVEAERVAGGYDKVDLHILPGPAGGFRRDGLWPRSVEDRVKMRERVLVPLCWMLPAVDCVTVRLDRKIEGLVKGERWVGLPHILAALKKNQRPLRPLLSLIEEPGTEKIPDLVTITLREAQHHQLRNSRVDEWLKVADWLKSRGFSVVFVRDSLLAGEPLPRHEIDPVASMWLEYRAALYASAALNLGVSNGPIWMALFMDVPTIMMRPVTDPAGGCYDSKFFKRCGLPRGSQLPLSPAHQRLIWEDDLAENTIAAAEDFLCAIG